MVDDDGGVRRSLTEILEIAGCAVDSAADGVEAMERLEAGRYDAVISDVVMPKMDGYELYMAIRKRWPGLPVADDDGLPLRQGPHHQAQPDARGSPA